MRVDVFTSNARITLSRGTAETLLTRISGLSEDERSEAEDPLLDAIKNGATVRWSYSGKGAVLTALAAWFREPGSGYLPHSLVRLRDELNRDLGQAP